MADYTDIFLFNSQDKSISLMKVAGPQAASRSGETGFQYVPTGLFYSKKNKVLYVANYKGNNILVFKVDVKWRRLALAGEIKSPDTKGPENVFLTGDGRFLAAANYDGGSVTAFDISGKKPVELWNTKITNAHGVCISEGKVYATGLEDRAVFELDMKTGRIVRRLGNKGWPPENNGFLRPTSIYPYSENELMVSDAHTGYIYIIDARTLSIKSYFGGNGPGFRYLHLPYSAIADRDRLIILSTFQRRILFGKKNSMEITESIGMDKNDWKHLKKRKDVEPLGTGWSDYIWANGPVLRLWNVDYVPGYGQIHPRDNTKAPVFKANKTSSLFNFNAYFYFLNALKTPGGGYLLFSAVVPRANYIVIEKGVASFVPVYFISEEHWRIGNSIHNPKGAVDVKAIEESARQRLRQLNEKKLENGLLLESDLNQVLFANATRENFRRFLADTFASKHGHAFLAGYRGCLAKKCSRERVTGLSKQYFSAVRTERHIDIDEFILVQMLTNSSPKGFFR